MGIKTHPGTIVTHKDTKSVTQTRLCLIKNENKAFSPETSVDMTKKKRKKKSPTWCLSRPISTPNT